MNEHPIQGLMDVTLERIKSMADANTVVGNPINMVDGTMILPVSKVSYGFASGGSDFPNKSAKDLFGGGSGGGVSITPVAFLVVREGTVKLLQMADHSSTVDHAISLMPEMVDKVTDLFGKKDMKKDSEKTKTTAAQ